MNQDRERKLSSKTAVLRALRPTLLVVLVSSAVAVASCGGNGDDQTPKRKTETRSAQAGPDTGSEPAESCGGGVSVNSTTACELARSVAKAYRSGDGPSSLRVQDPVTKSTVSMSCDRLTRVDEVPAVCTSGDKVVVYVR